MKRILKIILLVPPAIVVIILAVANRQAVVLSLDPFAPEAPAFAIEAPLFWLLFGALFAGIMLGGAGAWVKQRKWRRQARDKRREAERLRHEADRLKDIAQGSGVPGLPAPDSRRAA
ncbi:LapA family protein [Breoghania sp. L-A4]|nr:LapA family protein [Breoghania sp. L-A4]